MDSLVATHPFLLGDSYQAKPTVAISACLNGELVRYDGSNKALLPSSFKLLCKHLQLTSICPEVAIGMPVPRPPIQLEENGGVIQAKGRDNKTIDKTTALTKYAQNSALQLTDQLCGYIFKSKSPSCGLNSTPVFNQNGERIKLASGLQAEEFQRKRPWLVMVEETELEAESQCQQFIAYCRLLFDLQRGYTMLGLTAVDQHYRTIIEHMPLNYQAQLNKHLLEADQHKYWSSFMAGVRG